MGEKIIDIESKYIKEIERINYILSGLEKGYIYELNKGNTSLPTYIGNLKKELNELFNKIQYGKSSDLDKLSELF